MTTIKSIRLKKKEERRIRSGHPWIFSNEVDTSATPLKSFTPGEEVAVLAHDQSFLGMAYVNPHSLIAGRIFSRDAQTRLDLDFFKKKIQSAVSIRERLFSKPFYRLIFSEADGLPGVVIDRFGHDFVMQINTAGIEHKKDLLAQALRDVIPETNSILLRNDSQIREYEGLPECVEPLFGTPPQEIVIEENGVRFSVPLWKGQKTGWFYDHRMNRARLKQYVKDRSVLDVFSYLGGWAVQAAAFGASHVDCIEVSTFAGESIRHNAELNQVANKISVINEDAFVALKSLVQQQKTYDVIVLDPPAFVKRAKDHKEGLLAYQRINEMALKLLVPGGVLVTCSCSMHVSQDDFMQMLQRLAYRTQSTLQVLERGHQGPDHPLHISIPETDYLKAIFVRKI